MQVSIWPVQVFGRSYKALIALLRGCYMLWVASALLHHANGHDIHAWLSKLIMMWGGEIKPYLCHTARHTALVLKV
jgi:hypothetical protein